MITFLNYGLLNMKNKRKYAFVQMKISAFLTIRRILMLKKF